ncbi:Radical SAM domain protein [Methanoregula boonei 6A8]|uniref:Radical SAM domain protein n=1 Tax=Methanoregula boonei (strain DSM 21154 / JCM 14090 / 6A8) TaxID=456442 RepID=A7I9Z9_METB6|nr:radical SAM protein [Methanoregula boonei]ABS56560.1 Radical SAM domain protein [Methanoregula boonei 6A8]
MDPGLTAQTKAILINIGGADIDASLLPESMKTTATAGPGAGGSSFFIRSGSRRVRLSIKKESPLKVIPWKNGVAVRMDGQIIASGQLELPLCHCPDQAYITVSERCIFDCKFCPVPIQNGRVKTIGEIDDMVAAAASRGDLKAISLTSGVAESPEKEAEYLVRVVRHLASRYEYPIGVSLYPTATSTRDLREAGAIEIKYNVETMDREIFTRVCPNLSLDDILAALPEAVEVFGKNHVSSNFILGLGESDECVEQGVEILTGMGVIPNLRPISPHPLRKGQLEVVRPSSDRLIKLARINRAALDRHDLDVRLAQTMCLPCTGCDLTPHRDL